MREEVKKIKKTHPPNQKPKNKDQPRLEMESSVGVFIEIIKS